MGQYHYVVNLDKKEFLHPHTLGAGIKLWEQLTCHPGTAAALIPLLACSNGRGGGDFFIANDGKTEDFGPGDSYKPDDKDGVVGRWSGDRIAIVGDYAENDDLPPEFKAKEIYEQCDGIRYKDISRLVAAFIERQLGGKFTGEGWRDWEPKS